MRLLALDAATEQCSVALLCDGDIVERVAASGKAHSQQLLAMVEEVLAARNLALQQLDGIAASIGPGAFTGVRIGVAVAQGLAFGAGLRVAAVSTLEALALQAYAMLPGGTLPPAGAALPTDTLLHTAVQEQAAPPAQPVLACLDARMQEVYWGCFFADGRHGVRAATLARVGAPGTVSLPAAPCLGIGRGFAAYPELASLPGLKLPPDAANAAPRAQDVARLGALRFEQGLDRDPADLQPLYLRDKVALTEAERAERRLVI
jgi:tRNA threonylcarbamoyladenosine biosynthesis protein TsaB